jgi:hypothetical protein
MTAQKAVEKLLKGRRHSMLRLAHTGGQTVSAGNYWNFSTGERVHVRNSETLPGDADTSYYRLPPVAMLLLAPLLGLVYAVFLPLIGIAMLVTLLGRKLFGGLLDGFWKTAAFGWRPSEAYLLGRKKGGQGKKEGDSGDEPEV